MTTRSLKTLAIALGCAAVLGGESTSAQSANNHTSEYSARPLPALPRTNAGAKSGRLFVIQSPAGPREPTVPTADAKARIVRQSAAPKQIFTQPQTPPTQTVDQPPQPREIAASALALPFETVAELTSDEAVDQTGENVAEMTGEEVSEIINVEYHVAFQKLPQIDDQQLDLDVAPEPETDEDSAEFESDEAESDREPEDPSGAAEELDFEGEESADEADELAFEDEESDDERQFAARLPRRGQYREGICLGSSQYSLPAALF